jgi:hypothetical protein
MGAGAPAVGGTRLEYLGPTVAIDELSKPPYGPAIAAQKVQPWYGRKWGIIGIAVVAIFTLIVVVVGSIVGAIYHTDSHSAASAWTGSNSSLNGTVNDSNSTDSGNNSTNGTDGVAQGTPSTRAGQGQSTLFGVMPLPSAI